MVSLMSYGWEGEKVRLVPLDKERHLNNALRWLNDPEVTQWLLIGDFPLTRMAEEDWFDSQKEVGEKTISFSIETLEGEHVGFSGLHNVNYRHGYAETGTFIGAKECWGKGLGTDAALVRVRYAFEVLGVRLLLSGYLDGNLRSKRMLEKAGYREYGRVPKQLFKRGAYRDHVLMVCERG